MSLSTGVIGAGVDAAAMSNVVRVNAEALSVDDEFVTGTRCRL